MQQLVADELKTSCTTLPALHSLIAVVGFPWRPSDQSQHAFLWRLLVPRFNLCRVANSWLY